MPNDQEGRARKPPTSYLNVELQLRLENSMSQLLNSSPKADGQSNEIAVSQCPDLSFLAQRILKRLISQGE